MLNHYPNYKKMTEDYDSEQCCPRCSLLSNIWFVKGLVLAVSLFQVEISYEVFQDCWHDGKFFSPC